MKRVLGIVFFICVSFVAISQTRTIKGKVMDVGTDEPLSFCTIYLQGTTNGTTADMDGNYQITFSEKCDTAVFSAIGYKKQKIALSSNTVQIINAELERTATTFKTVTVSLGQDPAVTMFKRIQLHKNKNDKDKLQSYQYEVYNKLELDIDKINNKFKNNRLLKPFGFVYNYIDSTTDEKPFLPMYLAESISDFYYRKNPKTHKEVIKASQMAGGTSESLSQFLGTMYQDVNLYDNRVQIMGVYFISPIAQGGLFYYKYAITDTARIDGRRCYKLSFQPKRIGENTFIGDLWVNDTSWAIKQISMTIAKGANINFVNRISIFQDYTPINDTLWMCKKDKFIVDFVSTGKEKPGVIGRKTTQYRNFIINNSAIDTAFADKMDLIVKQGATTKAKDFWDTNRFDSLSKNERNIYKLVDTIQKVPVFKTYSQLFTTLSTGYKQVGYFEFGPYYNLYANNRIEGHRFGMGVGNSELLSRKMWAQAQIAYGTKDEKFKYDLNFWYVFKKLPRNQLKIRYVKDIVTYNLLDEQLGENNLLSSFVRRVPYGSKLTNLEETKITYNREWKSGFGEQLSINQTSLNANFQNDFYENFSSTPFINPAFINTEISLKSRFAYHEKFIAGDFLRTSIGSDYPIVSLELRQSIKGVLKSQFSYQKLKLHVSGSKNTGTIGSFYYNITAEKIFGNLPLLLLAVAPGNDTYYFDTYAFNTMHRYEFVSDQYISARFYEYLGGFPLNYIPLMKKLKWRTFIGAKAIWGGMTEHNKKLNGYYINQYFEVPNKQPFVELGCGINNIFKVFRVDFLWRLNYLDKVKHPYSQPFGLRGSLQIEF